MSEADPGKKTEPRTHFSIAISEKTTEKIADVVIDVFKPASQALGMLGDWVENRRGELQAIRTLRIAQRIAAEKRVRLEEPPPKFFIPFLRAASLEDPGDAEIRQKWAHLLVNAGARPDSITFFAASVLEKISSDEVAFLDAFVAQSRVLDFDTYESFRDTHLKIGEQCGELAKKGVTFVKQGRLRPENAIAAVLEQFQAHPQLRATSLLLADHDPRIRDREQFSAEWSNPELGGSVFLMLDSRNLFTRHYWKAERSPSHIFAVLTFMSFTELGFDFVNKVYR